jgi:murein DD-endopeptidase MepM/ murein hydrolase activator NlpD
VQDPINYVIFDLRKKIEIFKKQRPVTVKEVVASGVIKNSLFQTLAEKNVDERIAEKLADIYECEIDFFHIQQSDSFKVCYEQMFVEGNPVGSGKIKAAYFNYHKENYYAFYFDNEKEGAYFDEKGNSLRKGFLKAPLKFSHITSRFSMNRFHPILHRNKAHLGTDFAAPIGTPIMTTGSGTVLEVSYTSGNGNYVKVKHSSTYTTQYLHMSRFAKGIHRGISVKQGQVIGYVGMTGLATGPHVCYRFWKNGKQVDPMKEKNVTLNPISKNNKHDFEQVKEVWMKKLSAENSSQQIAGLNKTSIGSVPN